MKTCLFFIDAGVDFRIILESAAGLHHELVDAPVLHVLLDDQGATGRRQVKGVCPVNVWYNDLDYYKLHFYIKKI
jgi:hypothetical protein